MNNEKLAKANQLNDRIKNYERLLENTKNVLSCFSSRKPQQKIANGSFIINFKHYWSKCGYDWASYDTYLEVDNEINDKVQKAIKKLCKLQIRYYEKLISELQDEFKNL